MWKSYFGRNGGIIVECRNKAKYNSRIYLVLAIADWS